MNLLKGTELCRETKNNTSTCTKTTRGGIRGILVWFPRVILIAFNESSAAETENRKRNACN